MDFVEINDENEDSIRIQQQEEDHLEEGNFDISTNCRENLSFLLSNEFPDKMEKRSENVFLRPICIDAIDVSFRFNRRIRKNLDILPIDQNLLNVRAITVTLWYFISRGHTALAFLPSTLREYAIKCTDPHELFLLSKMDLITFENKSMITPIDFSKSIASCAETSNGIIVGSRKKYAALTKKFPNFINIFTNGFFRASFSKNVREFKKSKSTNIRMILGIGEIPEHQQQESMAFQLPAIDQLFVMNKISKLVTDDKMLKLCSSLRNNLEEICSESLQIIKTKKTIPSKLMHKSTVQSNIYNYNDPYLPEYVAPPPPKVLDLKKKSRIGHKNSIYRVGGEVVSNLKNETQEISLKGPLIEALTSIFGVEKAVKLVEDNPNIDDINELVELAW